MTLGSSSAFLPKAVLPPPGPDAASSARKGASTPAVQIVNFESVNTNLSHPLRQI